MANLTKYELDLIEKRLFIHEEHTMVSLEDVNPISPLLKPLAYFMDHKHELDFWESDLNPALSTSATNNMMIVDYNGKKIQNMKQSIPIVILRTESFNAHRRDRPKYMYIIICNDTCDTFELSDCGTISKIKRVASKSTATRNCYQIDVSQYINTTIYPRRILHYFELTAFREHQPKPIGKTLFYVQWHLDNFVL